MNKRALSVCLTLSALLLAACAGSPPAPEKLEAAKTAAPSSGTVETPAPAVQAPGVLLDRVVAVVNDEVILKSELDVRVEMMTKQIQQQHTALPPDKVLRKQVLDQMVTAKVELEQAADKGVTVTDDAVNQALSRIAARGGVTLEQLPDELKKEGLDYPTFRQDLRDQIIIQNLEQQVLNDRMHISQQELDDQMRADEASGNAEASYRLAQILITTPLNPSPDDIAAARKKADEIYQKLKAGADFAATAVASSDDQQALKGGEIGWRKGSELPTIFASVVTSMKPGDISEPIQSASGFHIVKLEDVKQSAGQTEVTQTHARHILVRPSALLSPEQAKAKIDDIYKQLQAGADFAKLAEADSDDPGSAKQGGDLGWLDPGATVPEFDATMNKLQPGEMSAPFKSQFGWHIVQVLGRRQAEPSEDSRKSKAYEALFARKSEEVIQQWLSELKDSAFIEYHLDD